MAQTFSQVDSAFFNNTIDLPGFNEPILSLGEALDDAHPAPQALVCFRWVEHRDGHILYWTSAEKSKQNLGQTAYYVTKCFLDQTA